MERNIKEEFKIKYQQADIFKITSICLTILFLGLISTPVTHAESYNFVTSWAQNNYGHFDSPESTAESKCP